MAAEKRGPILHAQIGMIQLIHGKPDGRIERGKKPARKYNIIKSKSRAPVKERGQRNEIRQALNDVLCAFTAEPDL